MAFKFVTDNRDYTSWTVIDSKTHLKVSICDLNPLKERFLNQDIFDIYPREGVKIVHSTYLTK